MSAAVKSLEDHGYSLDLGVADISGFLSFEEAGEGSCKLHVGQIVDVSVVKISGNSRVCSVCLGGEKQAASSVSLALGLAKSI